MNSDLEIDAPKNCQIQCLFYIIKRRILCFNWKIWIEKTCFAPIGLLIRQNLEYRLFLLIILFKIVSHLILKFTNIINIVVNIINILLYKTYALLGVIK